MGNEKENFLLSGKNDVRSEKQAWQQLIKALFHLDRWKIMILLSNSNRPLSFAEIRSYLDCSRAHLNYHLKVLSKAGIVNNIMQLDLSTDKPRFSFYELTPIGKEIVCDLVKIISKIKKN